MLNEDNENLCVFKHPNNLQKGSDNCIKKCKFVVMTDDELYNKLKDAYTEENLNFISSRLISLYKEGEYQAIVSIANRIKILIGMEENRINRIFSRLIMLYHPDKLNFYLQDIQRLYASGNSSVLFRYSHIFILLDQEEDVFNTPLLDFDDLFPDGQQWGYDEEDLIYFTNLETSEHFDGETQDEWGGYQTISKDFFSALKRKEYGGLQNNMQYYHLEELDGKLNLADYEIDDLTGVEFCKNISSLDLSDNNIMDLTKLHSLKQLTELYLSNNNIDEIGILYKLEGLKILDLSGNQVEDIRSLYHLDNLEYLNITGNPVPIDQLEELSGKGVIIVH